MLDAVYFRLFATVGVPLVWPPGSSARLSVRSCLLKGSGMSQWGFSLERRERIARKGEKEYVRVSRVPTKENTAFDTLEFMRVALT